MVECLFDYLVKLKTYFIDYNKANKNCYLPFIYRPLLVNILILNNDK